MRAVQGRDPRGARLARRRGRARGVRRAGDERRRELRRGDGTDAADPRRHQPDRRRPPLSRPRGGRLSRATADSSRRTRSRWTARSSGSAVPSSRPARAPTAPPIPGLEDAGYHTNETIFSLTALPRRLAVIGAGPIGCEMAQSFARFGSEVTVAQRRGAYPPARGSPTRPRSSSGRWSARGYASSTGAKVTRVERRGGERVIHAERDGRVEQVARTSCWWRWGGRPTWRDSGWRLPACATTGGA